MIDGDFLMTLSVQNIARALDGDVCGRNSVSCPGPGHSRADRSLSVTLKPDAPDGFICHSHAGDNDLACKDFIRDKLGLNKWKPNGSVSQRKIVATYDYVDEYANQLFQVVRFEPKDFRQRRSDGNGGWLWSLGEARRVPYRLPELIEAIATEKPVFIAEGEKAVDALVELGVPATCSPHGATKWNDEYSACFAGADVVVLPDNDEPGKEHGELVRKSLKGVAKSVKVLNLPKLPTKGDPFDWIAAGGTVEQLWQLVEAIHAEPMQPERRAGLVSQCAADIKPEKVSWLWDQRIPLGKCATVAGEGGLGKTMVLVWIASVVSKGGEWPCGEGKSPRGSVIILSAEDDAADTLVPRLMAADADCTKVHIVSAVRMEDERGNRSFNLQLDLPALEKKIQEIGDVMLVIIDPITSYLGKVDSHKNAETRSVLEPLGEMAARLRVSVIANNHVSKATVGSANNRVIGSVAFVNHARVVFIVTADAEDPGRRLFIPSKTNLGRPCEGLAYRIATTFVGAGGEVFVAPYVTWDKNTVPVSADEAVAAATVRAEARSAKADAIDFLRDALGQGPVPAKDVQKRAREDGHSEKALRTARESLRVESRREGFGPGSKLTWSLPKHHRCPNPPYMPTSESGHL